MMVMMMMMIMIISLWLWRRRWWWWWRRSSLWCSRASGPQCSRCRGTASSAAHPSAWHCNINLSFVLLFTFFDIINNIYGFFSEIWILQSKKSKVQHKKRKSCTYPSLLLSVQTSSLTVLSASAGTSSRENVVKRFPSQIAFLHKF